MLKPTKVWRHAPMLMLMTAVAVAAEATSNALRAYGLGEHLSQFTVATPWGFNVSFAGLVMVLGAAAISVYQAKFAHIVLTGKLTSQRWIASPLLLFCLAISVASMVSHVLEAQRAKGGGEGTARDSYDRTAKEFKRLESELESLSGTRSVATINAEILALKIPQKVWRRSRECQDINREDTKEDCKAALALYVERGKAARKSELEGLVAMAKGKLEGAERPPETSWLESQLLWLWPWLFGAGIVTVATFGYAVSTMQARPAPVAHVAANDTGPGPGRRVFTHEEAAADLVWMLSQGQATPSWGELAERWGWKSKGSVTKLVDALEGAGQVERFRDPGNGKRMLLRIAA